MTISPALWALPAPWSEEELEAASDIVVDVEVVEVVCLGPPVEDPQKTTVYYRATLVVLQTYKGQAPGQFQIEFYTEKWVGVQPVGGWHEPAHPVGQKAKLYLELKSEPYTYGIVWWNGMSELADSSPQELPDCKELAVVDLGPEVVENAEPEPDMVEPVEPIPDVVEHEAEIVEPVPEVVPLPDGQLEAVALIEPSADVPALPDQICTDAPDEPTEEASGQADDVTKEAGQIPEVALGPDAPGPPDLQMADIKVDVSHDSGSGCAASGRVPALPTALLLFLLLSMTRLAGHRPSRLPPAARSRCSSTHNPS